MNRKGETGNPCPNQTENYDFGVYGFIITFSKAHLFSRKVEKGPSFVRKKLLSIIMEPFSYCIYSKSIEPAECKKMNTKWLENEPNHDEYMDLICTEQVYKDFQIKM